MDKPITITVAQVIGWIMSGCGFITAIAAAAAVVWKAIKAARKPNEDQNRQIAELKKELDGLKSDVNGLKNEVYQKGADIDRIEAGNRITQKSLLALLSHGINGNSIDAMEQARDELTAYLIDK